MSIPITLSVIISLSIPIYYFLPSLRKNTRHQQLSSLVSASTSSIKPCPNPDCVRCQNYNQTQKSARRRLPQLLRHYHKKYTKDGTDLKDRIARGVKSEIILGPSLLLWRELLSIFPRNIIAMVLSFIPFCKPSTSRRVVLAPAQSGQYPTVLLVPELSVQPIVTGLHVDTISVFVTPSLSRPLDTSPVSSARSSTANSITKSKSIHEILLQEYIHSQHCGHWLVNDTPPTDTYVDTNTDCNTSSSSCWKVFHLINQGRKIQHNIDLCPQTYRILQSLRRKDGIDNDVDADANVDVNNDVLMEGCMFGNAFFSILYPGTRIEPHCGPTNVRHRMHFTLSVPPLWSSSSKTFPMQDGGEEPVLKIHDGISSSSAIKAHWKVDEVFVFDDSLMHSVDYCGGANGSVICGEEDRDSNGEWRQYESEKSRCRVVLIVDLWHPDLTAVERRLLRDLYPAP